MDDIIQSSSNPSASKTSCNSTGIGCPYNGSPIKYVKVNFHFYLDPDGTGNFNEINDGAGSTAIPYNGYQRAEDIVNEANKQLEVNGPIIFGPNPANVPICKIPMRLVLGGVYFHRIPKKGLCDKSVPSIWEEKIVNPNSEININMTSYTKDCPYVAGITGKGPAGITEFNGNYMGLFNDWESFQNWTKPNFGTVSQNNYPLMIDSKTLLHELIHTVGLSHPHEKDECEDTYNFKVSCWTYNPLDTNCNTWGKITNNIMDYNEQQDWVLTPCQICKIYESLSGLAQSDNQNEFVTQTGGICPPSNAFFDLPSDICLSAKSDKVWLQGSGSFNETGYTIEINEIDLNPNSNLTNYFVLDCSGQVGRIDLARHYKFEVGKSYKVRLKVKNACGIFSNVVTKTINIRKCVEVIGDDIAVVVNSDEFASLSIYPNPTHDEVSISYEMLKDGVRVSCDLYSTLTGQKLRTLFNNQIKSKGEYIETFDLNELQAGNYTLRFYTERGYRVQTISLTDY